MRILIAPDSFKGSNSSEKVADYIERGIRKVFSKAEIRKIPIADGGEGTVDALIAGCGGKYYETVVTGPLGEKVEAAFGVLLDGSAVIEMAAASGLPLVPENCRNPLRTTTYGTGELIQAALDLGCKKILIGIGGSATNDGGVGMAQALGALFTNEEGKEVGLGGGNLDKIAAVDLSNMDPRLKETEIIVACDIDNPLCGESGASAVFAPQKGATPEMVEILDQNLLHLAALTKEQLGVDYAQAAGAGAAGGLGFGLMAYCGAKMCSGIEAVLQMVQVDHLLDDCDLLITGEGKMDGQSIHGKVPVGIAAHAKNKNVPVLAIVGDIGEGAENVYAYGINSIMSTVNKAMSLQEAIARGGELLVEATERAMRMIAIGMEIKER